MITSTSARSAGECNGHGCSRRSNVANGSALLQEQIKLERRSLRLQDAILSKRDFVAGALQAFAGELQGQTGRPWKELKAELKIGQL
jgi:hypothetical protein